MVLKRFLNLKLLFYFLLINGSLTLLYTLIGFIEKLVRENNSSIEAIIIFMALNFIPTFFELIPLSSWITTCLLLWELNQSKALEAFNLLSINSIKIVKFFLLSSILLSVTSFIGKEIAIHPLIKSTKKYKLKNIRQEFNNKIFDKWLLLPNNSFLYFEFIDLHKNSGTGLIIIKMSDTFIAEEKIEAPIFILNPQTNSIILENSSITNFDNNTSNTKLKTLIIPELFMHLNMFNETPSLKHQIQNIILASNLSLHYPLNQELGKLLSRLLLHLQPLIYILLTLCLFLISQNFNWLKWLLVATPYPLLLVSMSFTEFMLQHNSTAFIVIIPYLIGLILIAVCIKKLQLNT